MFGSKIEVDPDMCQYNALCMVRGLAGQGT